MARKKKRHRTPEEKQAELSRLYDTFTDEIAKLTNGDAWTTWLRAARAFHRYSFGNQLLIMRQLPEATRVAPISTWNILGRRVRKGEHGAKILRPLTYKKQPDEDADDPQSPYEVRGYTTATVFDVAQTEGDALPDIALDELSDTVPTGAWDAIAEQVTARGFTIARGPLDSGAYGNANGETKTITIGEHLGETDAFVTLIHELAHVILGHADDAYDYRRNRKRAEVEAESVAYLVAGMLGIDAAPCSAVYVADWTGAEDPDEVTARVKATAARVLATAATIAEPLDIPDPLTPRQDAERRDDLVCPVCREPVRNEPPTGRCPPPYRSYPYSHLDGEPLCQAMRHDGYGPATPLPADQVEAPV